MTALAKALLVDDEREFVAILSQRLTRQNFSVISPKMPGRF
jgi:DNA-binding response OmpR family regulator